MRISSASFKMMILMVLVFSQVVTCQSSQRSNPADRSDSHMQVSTSAAAAATTTSTTSQSLKKIQDLVAEKVQGSRPKVNNQPFKDEKEKEALGSRRKSKSLTFYPGYYLPHVVPYGSPPGYFNPQNKDFENAYATEWLSRTEPFKRNTALIDSPTYYIRLPPNPYAFVPGLGYVSRPPSLSEPEVFETSKPEPATSSGNDLYHDPFYRLPINFVSNGKPTSVYQLPNDQVPQTKPETNFINLNKGPYVFNGKPSEIFLVAQIYNALYGDELNHFYP